MRCGRYLLSVTLCLLTFVSRGEPILERSDYNTRLWQVEDGLPHNIVQAVTQSHDGYLWVGTREGLARFDGVKFEKVDLLHENPSVSVLSLCQAHDGSLWIGTDRSGLFRLTAGRIERCKSPGGSLDF